MDTLFLWSAGIAGTVFLAQFALNLIGGVGVDTDFDGMPDVHVDLDPAGGADVAQGHVPAHSHASDLKFVGMFSLRAILAGITIFGLVGLTLRDQFSDLHRVVLALSSGFGTMYLMGWLIRSMHGLEHDGTVHLQDAVGTTGTVYLSVPGNKSGAGKVTLTVKGRTMECPATTAADSLPTGTPVEVVGVILPETVEVTRLVERDVT